MEGESLLTIRSSRRQPAANSYESPQNEESDVKGKSELQEELELLDNYEVSHPHMPTASVAS